MTTPAKEQPLTDLHPSGVPAFELSGKWGGSVWQNVDPRFANSATHTLRRLQKRRNPMGHDPNSIEQFLYRGLFRRTVARWKSLPENVRADLQRVARRFGYESGWTFYIGGNMSFFSQVLPFITSGGRKAKARA